MKKKFENCDTKIALVVEEPSLNIVCDISCDDHKELPPHWIHAHYLFKFLDVTTR